MRLIDADLISFYCSYNCDCTGDIEKCKKCNDYVCTFQDIEGQPTAYSVDGVVEELEERTDFLKNCTKYGNKNAKQQAESYNTMMMYEVADLVEDLIEIVKQGGVSDDVCEWKRENETINYEKVLRENLTECAFSMITRSEKDFTDWITRVKSQAKKCDELFRELKKYKDLEEQGLLLRLPCKVGETVHTIHSVAPNRHIICEIDNVDKFFLMLSVAEERFGKTVFLTQSEAEQKLKEMEQTYEQNAKS